MRLFKPAYTLPRPDGATILSRKGGKVARWKDRSGATRAAPLTKAGDRVRIETACYSIDFEDHRRVKRTLKAFSDKAASQRLADFVQRLVNCRRTAAPFGDDLQAFVNGLDDPTRQAFLSWGLLDAETNELARPLTELIAEYKAALQAKARNAGHIRETIRMLTEAFEACRFVHWRDIEDVRVEAHLRELREGPKRLSYRASNAKLQACRSFCRWVVKRQWAKESPLRSLDKLNAAEDPRHVRRALSMADLRTLVHKTAQGPERFGMTGYERHLLYRFVIETGLRRGELRRLKAGDFDFEHRTVTVRAERASKNKRTRLQALNPQLCGELRDFLANRLPGAKAFGGSYATLTDKTARMIRQDLEAAGLPYQDDRHAFFDFHSLRGETASLLAASGVPVNDAKDVLRHSNVSLTMDVYAKALDAGQKARTIAVLPDLSLPERQPKAATGTDDRDILRESYSQDGQVRTPADASGKTIGDTDSKPAFLDHKQGSCGTLNQRVTGSSPVSPSHIDPLFDTSRGFCVPWKLGSERFVQK